VIVVDFPDPTNFSLGKLYTTSFYAAARPPPGGRRLRRGADHLAADRAAQLLDRGRHAGGGGPGTDHAVPRPCAQLRRMGLHRRRPAAVPRADGAAAGLRFPDARGLPALLQFPPDMARVPAEPNRLSNQVLVHTFEEEWGRCTNGEAPRRWLAGAPGLAAAALACTRGPDRRRCRAAGSAPRTSAATACASHARRRRAGLPAAPACWWSAPASPGWPRRAASSAPGSTTCSCWSWKTSPAATAAATDGRHGLPAGRALPAAAGRTGARGERVAARDLGLLRQELGRTVADERHLCHSPQERLFFDGAWHEGLLPPADPARPRTLAQYRRFARARGPRSRRFAHAQPPRRGRPHMRRSTRRPSRLAGRAGPGRPALRWYLDYCCRDDYGAGLAPCRPGPGCTTSPAGTAFTPRATATRRARAGADLARRQCLAGAAPGRAAQGRHPHRPRGAAGARERQRRAGAGLATATARGLDRRHRGAGVPLFVAHGCWSAADALRQAAAATARALAGGQPAAGQAAAGPARRAAGLGQRGLRQPALGYVDAMHQSLRPHAGPTVLTRLPRAAGQRARRSC
jgi:hypothetical protein